jgi:hypothetical protein
MRHGISRGVLGRTGLAPLYSGTGIAADR